MLEARSVRGGAHALSGSPVVRADAAGLNLPELAVAYSACFRLGAIASPVNTRLKTAELRPLLQRLKPAVYLGQGAALSAGRGRRAGDPGPPRPLLVGDVEDDRAQS
jgi:acyl-coenzyme A synthetase/AMP-(fatty) acid ligase